MTWLVSLISDSLMHANKMTTDIKQTDNRIYTYISLFSSAGVGCYGFKLEGFECIATAELLERRLKIQKYNHKCRFDSGYICGDMTKEETKQQILSEYAMWQKKFGIKEPDVVVATPPCQGMSVANHKKTNEQKELRRNSLVVESLKMVLLLKPRFFVFENVRAFLNSVCTDLDGNDKPISEAISVNLGGCYNIYGKVINFKDYGSNSSRPRTLVVGVRKDLRDISPMAVFPDRQPSRTLREVIGDLPPLKTMGEMWDRDFYHQFRAYSPFMESWIADLKEGECAFDNKDENKRPHTVRDGKLIPNVRKNSDKYTRQYWDRVGPCIHTRNDILASQNTIHPSDNRVFSIRELMRMMTIPESFQWSDIPFDVLNAAGDEEKRKFLRKEEMNIRQNIGEAVPTVIFRQIASKVRQILQNIPLSRNDITSLIRSRNLSDHGRLMDFIRDNHQMGFVNLSRIAELANSLRDNNAAYGTGQDICFNVVKNLPDFPDSAELNIAEPSAGLGNFLPSLFIKYSNVRKVNLDLLDIDSNSIAVLKELLKTLKVPSNFHISIYNADSLLFSFPRHYDIVAGNPPYMKFTSDRKLLDTYKLNACNRVTNNLFSFFIEKAIAISDYVAMIVPKSLINAPEFNLTRQLMNSYRISSIIDYGEEAFSGVKIETVSFVLDTRKKPRDTVVESYITRRVTVHRQSYITDTAYPYWLIYRNQDFDRIAGCMRFNIFRAYRDRAITKKYTKDKGKIRVLKSRNIGPNRIIDIPGYDCYMDDVSDFAVSRYLNAANCYLVPNLTYYPRACRLPENAIADGSVALLTPLSDDTVVTEDDLAYYSTEEFTQFYKIARNMGTRSLNIDNNSVFFFGLKNKR